MAFVRKLLAAACLTVCGCQSDSSPCSVPPALPPVSQTLQIAGDTFDIVSSGPETGPVVLLLQGFPDHTFEYRTTMPRLAQAGYRAIAAIGHPVDDSAAQVLAIADALELKTFHVAGAHLAWEVARLAPERVLSVATTSAPQAAAIANLERAAAACTSQAAVR